MNPSKRHGPCRTCQQEACAGCSRGCSKEIGRLESIIADMARAMVKHELNPPTIQHGVSRPAKCPTCGRESWQDSPEDEKHTTDCRYAFLIRQAKEVAR